MIMLVGLVGVIAVLVICKGNMVYMYCTIEAWVLFRMENSDL